VSFRRLQPLSQTHRLPGGGGSVQIGELAHKLTDEFKAEYPEYNWNGAYRLRNIIGHDYDVVSNESLWKACRQSCDRLLGYVGEIVDGVEREEVNALGCN